MIYGYKQVRTPFCGHTPWPWIRVQALGQIVLGYGKSRAERLLVDSMSVCVFQGRLERGADSYLSHLCPHEVFGSFHREFVPVEYRHGEVTHAHRFVDFYANDECLPGLYFYTKRQMECFWLGRGVVQAFSVLGGSHV